MLYGRDISRPFRVKSTCERVNPYMIGPVSGTAAAKASSYQPFDIQTELHGVEQSCFMCFPRSYVASIYNPFRNMYLRIAQVIFGSFCTLVAGAFASLLSNLADMASSSSSRPVFKEQTCCHGTAVARAVLGPGQSSKGIRRPHDIIV